MATAVAAPAPSPPVMIGSPGKTAAILFLLPEVTDGGSIIVAALAIAAKRATMANNEKRIVTVHFVVRNSSEVYHAVPKQANSTRRSRVTNPTWNVEHTESQNRGVLTDRHFLGKRRG